MTDTEQAMTPREAADWIEAYEKRAGERPGGFGSMFGGPWGRALRVLIDHARASSPVPEGGDLAAQRDALFRAFVTAIEPGTSPLPHHLADVALDALGLSPSPPSVAAPPREDEDDLEPLSADIERMQTWMDALPSELESAALRSVLAAARRWDDHAAAASRTVRDTERTT